MNYSTPASDDVVQRTADALQKNGMNVFVVSSGKEAREKVLELLPRNSEVMAMSSKTLDDIGITDEIDKSGHYISARMKSMSLDRNVNSKEIQIHRSIPDWTVGSVHAVTQDGVVMVVSQSGSQLPAYSFSCNKVIWVVGTQKIVKDLNECYKRIYEYILPLENEHVKKILGIPHSDVNKIFILNREIQKDRITVILVKEVLGF